MRALDAVGYVVPELTLWNHRGVNIKLDGNMTRNAIKFNGGW